MGGIIVLIVLVIITLLAMVKIVPEQEAWIRNELTSTRPAGARHIVVFQHHPWFIATADEDDQYFNIPRVRREPLLALFREAGVRTLVSGHYHQNAVASDGGFDSIVTGAVGRPLGGSQSGFRVFVVSDDAIEIHIVAISGNVWPSKDVLRVEYIQAFVFHRAHVEIAYGDNHVLIEVKLQAELAADGVENPPGLCRDLRSYAVAVQYNDLHAHARAASNALIASSLSSRNPS